MKNLIIMGIIALLVISSGCSSKEAIVDQPGIDSSTTSTVNLSEEGLANCYIVQSPGIYMFKVDNQFNLGEGLPVPPKINPESAGLIWQSGESLIKSVELIQEGENSYVKFEVENAKGNALIAVYDEAGNIEWSWHIWMPTEEIYSIAADSGYEVMNLNLGAIDNSPGSFTSYGMLYQWGRKDPFPAAGSLTGDLKTLSAPMYDIDNNPVLLKNSSWTDTDNNTIQYSIENPTIVLSNNSQYSQSRDWLRSDLSEPALWGNPQGSLREDETLSYINKGVKTCYDPSPYGWRVPPADVFLHFTVEGGYAWDINAFNIFDSNGDNEYNLDDYNYGWHFMINFETPLYFPAASRFDGSYAMLMGSMSGWWGNYWSNSHSESMSGGALCALAFQVKDINGMEMITASPSASSSKADAFSIRCIKDNK